MGKEFRRSETGGMAKMTRKRGGWRIGSSRVDHASDLIETGRS